MCPAYSKAQYFRLCIFQNWSKDEIFDMVLEVKCADKNKTMVQCQMSSCYDCFNLNSAQQFWICGTKLTKNTSSPLFLRQKYLLRGQNKWPRASPEGGTWQQAHHLLLTPLLRGSRTPKWDLQGNKAHCSLQEDQESTRLWFLATVNP